MAHRETDDTREEDNPFICRVTIEYAFFFKEFQVHRVADKGQEPMTVAHCMLKDFSRALLIDM